MVGNQRSGVTLLGIVAVAWLGIHTTFAAEPSRLTLSCEASNDLYRTLLNAGIEMRREESPARAIDHAPRGSGVLLLADGYPERTLEIDAKLYEKVWRKKLRLYIEYPSALPEGDLGAPRTTRKERAVVASDFFGDTLKSGRILTVHDCRYVPATGPAHILGARVAGYNTAVYGLPAERFPLLFEHTKDRLLVATTKLSGFITGRYGPNRAWKTVWRSVLSWLSPGNEYPDLEWTPACRPTYGKEERLPQSAGAIAFRRGVEWYRTSGTLLAESRVDEIETRMREGQKAVENYAAGWMDFEAMPVPKTGVIAGDGTHGVLEGFSSRIRHDGSQDQRLIRRSDCMAEGAMALAFGGTVDGKREEKNYAKNTLDFLLFDSIATHGPRANREHPAFGLISWGIDNSTWENGYWGDDNARVLLSVMASAGLLDNDTWDEAVLKCLLGNLRTTGKLGFRDDCISNGRLEERGWRKYWEEPLEHYAPHYQCYIWACYLWAYKRTGYELFYERAETGIRNMMEAYPDRWTWTNGMAQERARMLLPLSWLLRVKETPEHRAWLQRIGEDLIALQQECGAIREQIGAIENGTLVPPQSNERYGVGEASLIQENGDPASDLLYTTNFAFLGLHEAARVTGDLMYVEAENRLAEFLCRIQIRSEVHPALDGGWYRAFDFDRWEYWASSSDAGWGAWCIESGWTQGWIVSVLGLREMDTSLWDLCADSRIERHFDALKPLFME